MRMIGQQRVKVMLKVMLKARLMVKQKLMDLPMVGLRLMD